MTRVCLLFGEIDSPIGGILVASAGEKVCAVEFADHERQMLTRLRMRYGDFKRVTTADPGAVCPQIRAYLHGTFDALDEIEVDGGGTDFQRKVWAELRRIAPGEVVTYGALARRLDIPRSVRAVARANALNPVNIAVPCHRVIGANGTLTGYSGGLARKRWLLEHEGASLRGHEGNGYRTRGLAQRAIASSTASRSRSSAASAVRRRRNSPRSR